MCCSRPSADPAWASYCTGSPVCLCVEMPGHGGMVGSAICPTPAFSLENTDEHPDLREHRQKQILANLELVSKTLWLLWFELWFWSLMDHTVDCSLHLNHPSIRSSDRDISVSSSAKCFTSWSITVSLLPSTSWTVGLLSFFCWNWRYNSSESEA